jgi:Zn-dependent protease with chaperone function
VSTELPESGHGTFRGGSETPAGAEAAQGLVPAVEGFYFDGITSRRHEVRVGVSADGVAIVGASVDRVVPWAACQLSERTRHGPRQIELGAGARIEIPRPDVFNAALAGLGRTDSIAVRMQRSWRVALLSIAGCLLVFGAAYQWLLPWAASVAADRIPQSILVAASDQAVAAIDEWAMTPTRLPADRQARLRQRLAALAPKGISAELLFRDGGRLGANALALPSGKIIVTDQLASLLDDDQIVAVLAHEIGHVVYRHGMRNVLQSSAVALAAAWYLGDVSSILAGSAATFATLHYSRDFEYEADAYGASLLRANAMAPALLAGALEKIEAAHIGRSSTARDTTNARRDPETAGSDKVGDDYWSTHPGTSERMRRLLTRED